MEGLLALLESLGTVGRNLTTLVSSAFDEELFCLILTVRVDLAARDASVREPAGSLPLVPAGFCV